MAFHQWNGMGFAADLKIQRGANASCSAKKQMTRSLEDQTVYSNLTRYSNEKCLFCRRLFFNKLQLYMHNTRHLYIPVEKQQLPDVIIKSLIASQNLVSNSITEESQASDTKNPKNNKQIKKVGFKKMIPKTYDKIQEKELDREILNHKDNLLKDLMTDCTVNLGENIPIQFERETKKEPENAILSNFTNNCIVNLNDFFSTIQTDSNNVIRDSNFGKIQPESSVTMSNDVLYTKTIKNIFLNNNITVKRVVTHNNELNSSIDKVNNSKSGKLELKEPSLSNMLLVGKKKDNLSMNKPQRKSKGATIAYDKLAKHNKTGVLCKICFRNFTTRYEAILHESRHMVLRIPRIDVYLNRQPYRCHCLEKFATSKLYSEHAKHCSKGTSPTSSSTNSAIKKNNLKKERENKKTMNNLQVNKKIKLDKARVTETAIDIDNDLQTIDCTNIEKRLKKSLYCHYCKSESATCSDQCPVIRSDMMRSGESTYFCKECFSKMEANLTKVGMYNGENFRRRCVVCNSAGNNFVLALMTAECVLGI